MDMVRRVVLTAVCVGLAVVLGACASSGNRAGVKYDFDDRVNDYLEEMRVELAKGKTDLINRVMNLSDSEAEVFWEIFQAYEDEYFALGDRRRVLELELSERTRTGRLDDQGAARLASAFLDLRDEMNGLLHRTHARMSAELSPRRAAQFLQIEHRSATVVDLVVASEMPLITGR